MRKPKIKLRARQSAPIVEPVSEPAVQSSEASLEKAYYRPIKQQICIRLDLDILDWFKQQPGGKYQSLINQVLRQHMDAHRDKH